MNALRVVIGGLLCAALLAGCIYFATPAKYEAPGANKGEVAWINACIRDKVNCRWLRWKQIDAFTYGVVDTYAFRGADPMPETRYSEWCDGLSNAGARVWQAGGKARTYIFKQGEGGQCRLYIPRTSAGSMISRVLGRSSSNYHFARFYKTKSSRGYDIKISVLDRFGGATRTRAVYQSAFGMTVYGESTAVDGKVIQPSVRDGHAYVLDFTTKPSEPLRRIGMSGYPSWKEYGADYMQVWYSKLAVPVAATVGTDAHSALQDAVRDYSVLGLNYAITHENQGTRPQLTANQVIGKKKGDCKDLSVVLASMLAKHGLSAQPILTRLSPEADQGPALRRIPQLSWPNHVLLYVPAVDVYLDATLADNNYVVSPLASDYRSAGVNLVTGKFVIIGESKS